jgi:hypothetical protein
MYRRLSRAAHRNEKDAGIGMIMVIALAGVITVLIGVLFTIAINSLAGSNRHQHFDLALTSAESGIDKTLARLQLYYNEGNTTSTYTTPSTGLDGFEPDPVCDAPVIPWGGPFQGATAQTDERNWAISRIKALVAAHPSCLQHSDNGDYATIAPGPSAAGANPNAVYSMGWAPGYGEPKAKSRLIKAEYLFVPYTPHNAILTAGDLEIDSSTTVNGVGSNLADVHSNGSISTQGNPTVTGQVSSTQPSGGCGNRCGGSGAIDTTPAQGIPTINARNFYSRLALTEDNWYDLCPDGAVHYPSSSTPCTGSVVPSGDATTVASSGFHGWSFLGSNGDGTVTWQASKSGISLSGTYYVYNGNVTQGQANRDSAKITVIAQSVGSSCPKKGGNITWQHSDIPGPSIKGLFFLADADLLITSNFGGGTEFDGGLFLAGDQIEVDTSSQADYGGIIAADQCTDGGLGIDKNLVKNLVKNPVITYLPNVANFFDVVIDTTLWLEYPGA